MSSRYVYTQTKELRVVRFPPKSFVRFFWEIKGKLNGENHGKRALDERVGSEVYHARLDEKRPYREEKLAAD